MLWFQANPNDKQLSEAKTLSFNELRQNDFSQKQRKEKKSFGNGCNTFLKYSNA